MDKTFPDISSILRIPSQFRNSSHIDYLMKLTQDVQFFSKISTEQKSNDVHRECCKVMNIEKYAAEEFLFNFGDKGDKFYIILSGSVSVKVPSKKKILISKAVVSKIECILDSDSRKSSDSEDFFEDPEKLAKIRMARKRDGLVKVNVKDVMNSLRAQVVLTEQEDKNKAILSNEEKNLLTMFKRKVKEEQRILLNAVKHSETETLELEFDDFTEIGVLTAGGSFGELALISHTHRSASIQAREDSSFLVINKLNFAKILGNIAEKKVTSLVEFLQKVPYFQSRSKSSLLKISFYFQPKRFKKDQKIFRELDQVDGVYLIKEGEVTITKKKPQSINSLSVFASTPTDYQSKFSKRQNPLVDVKIVIKSIYEGFGGYEIITQKDVRAYTCTCSSASCELLFIPKTAFMSRIPHLDLIRGVIIDEHERLMDWFFEKKISDSPVETDKKSPSPFVTRVKSPLLHSPFTNIFKVGSVVTKNYFSRPRNVIFRKMSKKEISEAVNGRKSVMKKYGSKVSINSSFSSIPHQFSNQSFHISKNFLQAKNG